MRHAQHVVAAGRLVPSDPVFSAIAETSEKSGYPTLTSR
jgi:hypothetical protein